MIRSGGVLALLAGVGCLGAVGCDRAPRPPPSPIVAPDASGHTPLLVDHAGTYDLTSVQSNNLGHLSPQLRISPSISCYATWHTEAVGVREAVANPDLIRLHATLVVVAVRHPVLIGYTLDVTRMGASVVAIAPDGEHESSPPFVCPRRG